MASLAAHLAGGADHGRLGFHPDCPVCRSTRLLGSPPPSDLLPPAARAGVLAAVLGASTLAPTAAFAAPPDEGLSLPGGEVIEEGPAPGEAPAEDPGVDENDPAPPPEAGEEEADTPEETVPDDSQEPDLPDEGFDVPEEEAPDATVPPPAAPVQPPPVPETKAQPGLPDVPEVPRLPEVPKAPEVPTPPLVSPESLPPTGEKGPVVKGKQESGGGGERQPESRSAPAPEGGAPAPGATQPAAPEAPTPAGDDSGAPTAPAGGGAPAPQPGGSYTVRSGDTLWAIAERLLGPGASIAEVAEAVDRLWKLNGDRIGTGDPDLITAGQKLRIPKGLDR